MEHLFTLIIDHLPATFARIPGIAKAIAIPLLWVGPVALTSKILMSRNALTGAAGNMVGGWVGKARGANNQWRSNMRKRGVAEKMEGRRGSLGVGAVMNRFKYADQGGLSPFKRGRSRYKAIQTGLTDKVAGQMVEQDKGRSGGDDDAMFLASQRGMTSKKFLQDYAAMQVRRGATQQQADRMADDALGRFEGNFNARLGTNAARVAAFKAWMGSNTSAKDDKTWDTDIARIGAELINDGVITNIDAAVAAKSNKMRGERSGVGFSTWLKVFDEAAQNDRRTSYSRIISEKTSQDIRQDSVNGMDVGQLAGGRHEAVRLLAPTVYKNLEDAVAGRSTLGIEAQIPEAERANWTPERLQSAAIQKALAQVAAIQDVSGQISGLKNDHNVIAMETHKVRLPGSTVEVTAREAVEFMRAGQMPAFDSNGDQVFETREVREKVNVYDNNGKQVFDQVQTTNEAGAPEVVNVPRTTEVVRTVQVPKMISIDNAQFNTRRRELGAGAAMDASMRARTPDMAPGALPGSTP